MENSTVIYRILAIILGQITKIINVMWGNNSFDIMMYMHCVEETSAENSILTSSKSRLIAGPLPEL